MKKIAFIGYGAMARTVREHLPDSLQLAWVVTMEGSQEALQHELGPDVQVVTHSRDIQGAPDLVLEMAGQEGLKAHVFDVLQRGWRLAVISVECFCR